MGSIVANGAARPPFIAGAVALVGLFVACARDVDALADARPGAASLDKGASGGNFLGTRRVEGADGTMKNRRPDGQTARELLEAALEGSAALAAAPAAPATGDSARPAVVATTTVVGEILDTHNPHLPGRVLARFRGADGAWLERWLQRERHLSLQKGDRVLVTLPSGWNEWLVTGALGREAETPLQDEGNLRTLQLGPGERVSIQSHTGETLLTLRQGPDGAVLELGSGNVELAAARTLRLRADTIELVSSNGGIDVRTDGDAVFRARTIRLN